MQDRCKGIMLNPHSTKYYDFNKFFFFPCKNKTLKTALSSFSPDENPGSPWLLERHKTPTPLTWPPSQTHLAPEQTISNTHRRHVREQGILYRDLTILLLAAAACQCPIVLQNAGELWLLSSSTKRTMSLTDEWRWTQCRPPDGYGLFEKHKACLRYGQSHRVERPHLSWLPPLQAELD